MPNKIYLTTGLFFVFFVLYAFWSVNYLNDEPTVIGPACRSLVVGMWLLIFIFLSRRPWKNDDHIGFLIGLSPSVFFSLLILSDSRQSDFYDSLVYCFSLSSYLYVAALSTYMFRNGFAKLILWIVVLILQLMVDLLMSSADLYGSYPGFHT